MQQGGPETAEVDHVRVLDGPEGAPTVVLLHGWTSTAEITWHGCFSPLAETFSVVAPDLRGHGGGPRQGAGADLELVAQDVAALIEQMSTGPVIVAGYSLGGAVGQVLARDRPDLVRGLVVCASACRFTVGRPNLLGTAIFAAGQAVAAVLPDRVGAAVGKGLLRVIYGDDRFQRWVRSRMGRHRWSAILGLGAALYRFDSEPWIGDLQVPVAVVATADDRHIPLERQVTLAELADAALFVFDGGHDACLRTPDEFAGVLRAACEDVVSRAGSGRDNRWSTAVSG